MNDAAQTTAIDDGSRAPNRPRKRRTMLATITTPIDLHFESRNTDPVVDPCHARRYERPAIVRVPQLVVGGALIGASQLIRFAGCMVLLGAIGLEVTAHSVVSR